VRWALSRWGSLLKIGPFAGPVSNWVGLISQYYDQRHAEAIVFENICMIHWQLAAVRPHATAYVFHVIQRWECGGCGSRRNPPRGLLLPHMGRQATEVSPWRLAYRNGTSYKGVPRQGAKCHRSVGWMSGFRSDKLNSAAVSYAIDRRVHLLIVRRFPPTIRRARLVGEDSDTQTNRDTRTAIRKSEILVGISPFLPFNSHNAA
jgi:hypothetical protein